MCNTGYVAPTKYVSNKATKFCIGVELQQKHLKKFGLHNDCLRTLLPVIHAQNSFLHNKSEHSFMATSLTIHSCASSDSKRERWGTLIDVALCFGFLWILI